MQTVVKRLRLPQKYTILVTSTGRTPITLTIHLLPVLLGAVLLGSLPLICIGLLGYQNLRLAQRNQTLTQTAQDVLTQLEALDADIQDLKVRVGLESGDQGGDDQGTTSDPAGRDRALPRQDSNPESDSRDYRGQASGNSYATAQAEALFAQAQLKIPAVAATLEIQVRPTLEAVLAIAADRADAFPGSQPLADRAVIILGFGSPSPEGDASQPHDGLDFKADIGDPVYATADGTVTQVETDAPYGQHLILTHDAGYTTLYAHLSEVEVEVGDEVEKGEVIGLVGETGQTSKPQLHYGIYHHGQPVNPQYYLNLENLELES